VIKYSPISKTDLYPNGYVELTERAEEYSSEIVRVESYAAIVSSAAVLQLDLCRCNHPLNLTIESNWMLIWEKKGGNF
tara:strand:- start:1500 stop:1733 length:234 start_codon:yes stop_codon:yes gene_type:complete